LLAVLFIGVVLFLRYGAEVKPDIIMWCLVALVIILYYLR
jgi:hypothetical protein